MLERIMVTLVNIFFPPIAVMMVAGVGPDALLNTLFFIAGVIPGHIHGFYITCTYFHRKGKVRRGRYPGGRAGMIYSRRVLNGDASSAHVRELKEAEMREKENEEREMRRRTGQGRRSWGLSSKGTGSPKSESSGW